jgi:hypothetical protein
MKAKAPEPTRSPDPAIAAYKHHDDKHADHQWLHAWGASERQANPSHHDHGEALE